MDGYTNMVAFLVFGDSSFHGDLSKCSDASTILLVCKSNEVHLIGRLIKVYKRLTAMRGTVDWTTDWTGLMKTSCTQTTNVTKATKGCLQHSTSTIAMDDIGIFLRSSTLQERLELVFCRK